MHRSKFRRAFRRYVPFWVGRALRALYYYPGDIRDTLLRRRNPLVPPRAESAFVGDGDFAGMGRRFLDHFVTLADLKPVPECSTAGAGSGVLRWRWRTS